MINIVNNKLKPTTSSIDTCNQSLEIPKGVLQTGENQRADGRYEYKYVDAFGFCTLGN